MQDCLLSTAVPEQAGDNDNKVIFMFESASQDRVSGFELKLKDVDSKMCASSRSCSATQCAPAST